jgi:hypothetical protein
MKKLFAFTLVIAMPASAASLVKSPVVVQPVTASPQSGNVPLAVGGYATLKGSGKCCTIVRITDMVISTDPDHQPVWIGTFYSDTSGNLPANNDYWRTAELRFSSSDLQGVTVS